MCAFRAGVRAILAWHGFIYDPSGLPPKVYCLIRSHRIEPCASDLRWEISVCRNAFGRRRAIGQMRMELTSIARPGNP